MKYFHSCGDFYRETEVLFMLFTCFFTLFQKNIEAEGSKGQYVVCNHSNTTGLCDVIKQTIRLLFPFKIYRQIMKIGQLGLITTLQSLIIAKLGSKCFCQCQEKGPISLSSHITLPTFEFQVGFPSLGLK